MDFIQLRNIYRMHDDKTYKYLQSNYIQIYTPRFHWTMFTWSVKSFKRLEIIKKDILDEADKSYIPCFNYSVTNDGNHRCLKTKDFET